jgi:hypothetical protein
MSVGVNLALAKAKRVLSIEYFCQLRNRFYAERLTFPSTAQRFIQTDDIKTDLSFTPHRLFLQR